MQGPLRDSLVGSLLAHQSFGLTLATLATGPGPSHSPEQQWPLIEA